MLCCNIVKEAIACIQRQYGHCSLFVVYAKIGSSLNPFINWSSFSLMVYYHNNIRTIQRPNRQNHVQCLHQKKKKPEENDIEKVQGDGETNTIK